MGLIPGGGGTKEFTLRASDEMHEDEPETITLKTGFLPLPQQKLLLLLLKDLILGSYGKA